MAPRPKPYGSRPPPERRGPLWWIFNAPGHAYIWFKYHWPGRGQVQATWRRFNNPFVEILYSLTIYTFVFLVAVLFFYLANGDRELSNARAAASSSVGSQQRSSER